MEIEFTDHIDEVKAATAEAISRALTKIGLAAEGYAKLALTDQKAVDTGNLRNSVTYSVDDGAKAVHVGTNVSYAVYVEMGTGQHYSGGTQTIAGMAARPYIKPSIANHKEEYHAVIMEELTKE